MRGDKRQDKPGDKTSDKPHDKPSAGSTRVRMLPAGRCPRGPLVIVTLSAVALFGLLTFVLIRTRYVGPAAALAVFPFGFFTADTGASTAIRAAIQALIDAASAIA